MDLDLVIRNGTVVDGTGQPGYRADVGVSGRRIAEIGEIDGRGRQEIDAEGHVVSPGFMDGHTHMDAQVFWDPLGSCSCWHGVTTVLMGNCGFSLAPVDPMAHELVVANLENAEDIPAEVMAAALDWSWESFPEYLDAVDRLPKGINFLSQIGHSALRTWAMGERAFTEEANEEDLATMARALGEAIDAGAFGFTTSVINNHHTLDGRPVASRLASWPEICTLVGVLGERGAGVFEIATDPKDAVAAGEFFGRLQELAVTTKVPVTFGLRRWNLQLQLDLFDAVAAAGGRMFGQSRCEPFSHIMSFKTTLPFDRLVEWREIRSRPIGEQLDLLRQPAVRARLVGAARLAFDRGELSDPNSVHPQHEMPPYEEIQVLLRPSLTNPSVAELAKERGVDPVELMIELAIDTDFEQTFGRFTGWAEEDLLTAMSHPRTVMTFSDSGAHVTEILGASIQTRLFSHWVRERGTFTLEQAVRMLTDVPASFWGVPDRGQVREGMIADLNIFDPEVIAPGVPTVAFDLPTGAPRIKQKAEGIHSTIVGGAEILRDGEHTGALPGELIRGPRAAR